MTYVDKQDAADNFDLIVGGFLKCPKGKWCLDDAEIPTGPGGVKATILMTTARHGCVEFRKTDDVVKPIVTALKRYADCDPSREKMAEGQSPYTITQVLVDDELATFAASSWAARKSFKKLVDNWRIVHPREFPVVTLGTRPTGDANDNIAPTFKPVAWVPISDFVDMLPDAAEKPQLTAPTSPIDPPDDLVEAPPRGRMTVTSGRPDEAPPPIDADEYGAIGDPIPF